MKTYTIEELRLAQAKGCRIQMQLLDESWLTPDEPLQELLSHHLPIRIHPADEWKARLPRLRDGAEWACQEFVPYEGHRPRVLGEIICYGPYKGLTACYGLNILTDEPVPPEFLHPDELAKQTEAFTGGQKVSVDWHDPHGDGSYAGEGEFIRHLVEGDVGDELLKDGPHVVVKCTPDDSGSIFPMSAVKVIQQPAPQTDTPETDRISKVCGSFEQFIAEFESMERRAIAAEARVKEIWEAIKLAHGSLNQTRKCLNVWFNASGAKCQTADAEALADAESTLSKLQPFLP